jgi:excisionase family DNA binding protein
MKPFTFDQIPKMMNKLFEKMDRIEQMLSYFSKGQIKQDELLTISEASQLLKLAIPTIYSKVSKNEIPVNKQGKKLYFYKSELIEWVRAGRVKTNEEIVEAYNLHKQTPDKRI